MNIYDKLVLSHRQLNNSIKLQVLAHHYPERINWLAELWTPTNRLDRISRTIRQKEVVKTSG